MVNAATAIVGNGVFIHYCHKSKTFVVFRIHWSSCPFCSQKNPDYIPNNLVYTVINLKNDNILLTFANQEDAISYIIKHPLDNLALGDTGYVQ